MHWLWLLLSIIFEVTGTAVLTASARGYSFIVPSWLIIGISYFLCFVFMQFALKYFDLGLVYAIWSGLGVLILAIIGIIFFNDNINILKVVSIFLIVIGVSGLSLSGISH